MMDFDKVIEELTDLYKNEHQAADYAWLVFLYNLDLVNNVLFTLHTTKDKAVKVPKKYHAAYYDIVDYYNRYYGGKNETTV